MTRSSRLRGYEINLPGGELFFAARFLDPAESDDYFRRLACGLEPVPEPKAAESIADSVADSIGETLGSEASVIRWRQEWLRLYGKAIRLPRVTAWYGDAGVDYTYSGIRQTPNAWTPELRRLRKAVERCANARFNSVLLNGYRDGNDTVGWHADDEPMLGSQPVIASLSFGQTRDFVIRRRQDKSCRTCIPLGHGSLLVMRGDFQRHWEHSVPRRKHANGLRVNLTFRWIRPAPACLNDGRGGAAS